MPTIRELSQVTEVVSSDQIPLYSTVNGQPRKASMLQVKEFIEEGLTIPGGILAISSMYGMGITTPVTVALTTSFANIPNYDNSFALPSGSSSFSTSTTLGEFVATRDMSAVVVYVTLNGEWPTNRDLSLSIYVGSNASPYETQLQFVSVGRGAGAAVTACLSGPVTNQNNVNGTILAGEKVRLVAKFNTADNLDIDRLSFVVQTLDGV